MAKKSRKNGSSIEEYKKKFSSKLHALQPVFARALVGDFSKNVKLPKKEDEFSELYAGIQIMIEIVREKLAMMEEVNHSLEEKIRKLQLSTNDELFVGVNGILIKINTQEIIFVKAVSDYVIIHTDNNKYIIHSTMKGLFDKLSEKDFMRVHHSYIVCLPKITEKHKDHVMVGETKIPVSRANRKSLLLRLKTV